IDLSNKLANNEKSKAKILLNMLNELFSYRSLDSYALEVIEGVTKLIPKIPTITKDSIPRKIGQKLNGFIQIQMLPPVEEKDSKTKQPHQMPKVPEGFIFLQKKNGKQNIQGDQYIAYWEEDHYDQKSEKWVR